MRAENLEKVLERIATTEKTTIVTERSPGGKMRATSGSWDGEKVLLRDQVLEVRNVEGRLHVSRKSRHDLSGFWQRIRQERLDRVALVQTVAA
jgi:hypothetical protein